MSLPQALPYSLAQQAPVSLQEIASLIADKGKSQQEFYDNCNAIFPVVLGPMSPSAIASQRAPGGWRIASQTGGSDRATLLHDIQRSAGVYNFIVTPPAMNAINLPGHAAEPLLAAWKQQGATLYGCDDFTLNFVDILRRDAAPTGPVVGSYIHDDLSFEIAYRTRGFSILSIVGDEALHAASPAAPFWATHWHDMRALPLDDFIACKAEQFTTPMQKMLADTCPAKPLPIGQYCLFPSFQIHSAGGMDSRKPGGLVFPEPQPKAFVSHLMLSQRLGTLSDRLEP